METELSFSANAKERRQALIWNSNDAEVLSSHVKLIWKKALLFISSFFSHRPLGVSADYCRPDLARSISPAILAINPW